MKKYNKRHRIIATFFLLIFFPTLIPTNLLASTTGPRSPEAASFEPVDATDMVNLITGQYSYVLPLLNVPSPEGGYPVALSYHAGIAMDQEASWAGLGWNVNPGAIERSINGYPDDYNSSKLSEYFWDQTHTETRYTASIGFSNGAISVGVGLNWGSNQALGGTVSIGGGFYDKVTGAGAGMNTSVGFGSNSGYSSVGIDAKFSSGLTVGMNADTNGDVGVNAGFNSNGSGFSVGYNTNGTTSIGLNGGTGNDNSFGLDISFSSSGVGISGGVTNKTGNKVDGGAGTGMFFSFNNTIAMGDYVTSSSSWMIPIFVPTPAGVFSATFGKQKFKYWMGKNVYNYVSGPVYFYKGVIDSVKTTVTRTCYYGENCSDCDSTNCKDIITQKIEKAFMDINEISFDGTGTTFSENTDVALNNMTFPSYDNFSLSGQGISGSMSATIYKNGALFGLDGKETEDGYALKYNVNGNDAANIDYLKFNSKPHFEFDNEITSYLGVNPATFNSSTTITNIENYYSGGVDINDKPRRKTSNYIEYFTNEEITNSSTYTVLKANGFLLPNNALGFERSVMPKDGIGAFKVTTVDGKTYHYSLPVYNHEIITRTYGVIPDSPAESQSYFEKRQLEPFATHWLLTAVTGPDYVDNGDGVAGEGDLGYWTSFEYGKWTDAFIWKNTYKKDFLFDRENPKVKTWIKGRKELYYLNKIKTRTHTALFLKGFRDDAYSPQWDYYSADHMDNKQNNKLNYRFTFYSKFQLRLEKIVLLKNEDDYVLNPYKSSMGTHVKYNQSNTKEDLLVDNWHGTILRTQDISPTKIEKAEKVIDFNYDYSLVTGDNRLTLKSVNFKGNGGANVLPPYKFEYEDIALPYNVDNKDEWGYCAYRPSLYSLNKITTPQGGTINIGYEENKFKPVVKTSLRFSNFNNLYYKCTLPNSNPSSPTDQTAKKVKIEVGINKEYHISVGQTVAVDYELKTYELPGPTLGTSKLTTRSYKGDGQITTHYGGGSYEVTFNNYPSSTVSYVGGYPASTGKIEVKVDIDNTTIYTGGGPRVANIKVSQDASDIYVTDYKYGNNEDGIGYVSYLPYSQNIVQELPYSAELPAPRVMYEYVNVSSHKEGFESNSKLRYKFNIIKEKSPDKIKFGDFYEIIKTANTPFVNNSAKQVSVNSFTVKENFAALGQLLEISTLNSKNQLLNKVYTTYYSNENIPNNIGVAKESYQSYKEVDYTDSNKQDKWVINSSTRIKYPNIVKSSTEQKNGYTYTTAFNDYDLVSGISKEQVYTSSDGQSYMTRVVPAYTISQYNPSGGYGMGSKVDNANNKNMLSQTAREYSYIWDKTDNKWKETGVGITTWSNIWSYKDITGAITTPSAANEKIWRKHKTYVWNGVKDSNGIFSNYNSTTDDGFNWTVGVGSQPVQWKQISETTLYDHFSAPLEMKDINGNLASTKMGDNDTKVVVSGNAGYNEIYYTGAENTPLFFAPTFLEPEIKMTSAIRNTSYFHTGKQSVETTSASQFGIVMGGPVNTIPQHRAGKYKVSVWVKKDNVSKAQLKVNGNPVAFVSDNIIAGNWQLKTAIIDVPAGACTVYLNSSDTSTVYYDDLMVRPVASSITGYVYNEWDELTHIIGNNGLATKFEYDAAGRLIKTFIEVIDDSVSQVNGGFKLVKTNTYNNRYQE